MNLNLFDTMIQLVSLKPDIFIKWLKVSLSEVIIQKISKTAKELKKQVLKYQTQCAFLN